MQDTTHSNAVPSETSATADSQQRVTMFTTRWCGDCVKAKNFLDKLGVPYDEVDIETDPEAAALVMEVNQGRRSVPTLLYDGDAASLSNFSRAKLDDFLSRNDLLAE